MRCTVGMDSDGKDENAFSSSFLKLSINLSISSQFEFPDGVTAEFVFVSSFVLAMCYRAVQGD